MLEKLLQFVLKLMPKPIKDLFYKYESVWRYCYYGAWTTLISYVTAILAAFVLEAMGYSVQNFIPQLISTVFSWVCAATFAFVVNKKYVFMSKTNTTKELLFELGTFMGARLASLGIEEVFLALTVNVMQWNFFWMKLIAQVVVLIMNYIFSKLVVFKKGSKNNAASEEPPKDDETA